MKKILFLIIAIGLTIAKANAQQINIQLWGENAPIVFQSHTSGTAGDYGKFTSDQQLEFWESDNGGIDMRWTAEASYATGRIVNYAYIYHGKREGNKIIFTTREDGDSMEGSEPEKIDPSYQPYEVTILNPKQVSFDRCTYTKMKMDFSKGKWLAE